jgi:hypothetical protein
MAGYPATPVVYRRPVLRAIAGILLVGTALGLVYLVWSGPTLAADERLGTSDWWIPVALLITLGGFYLYASTRLILSQASVLIVNPVSQIEIPLGHVTDALPGGHLVVVTGYGRFRAWAVEAANVQMAAGEYGTQQGLADLIKRAAASGDGDGDKPRAHYRPRVPDALFLLSALALLGCPALIFGT